MISTILGLLKPGAQWSSHSYYDCSCCANFPDQTILDDHTPSHYPPKRLIPS